MKTLRLTVIFLIMAAVGYAQGSELERRNGFKDIKLGSAADSLKGAKLKKEFKENDEFDAQLFEVDHPDYNSIGEVEIRKLEIKAYKNLIYEITVVTPKDPRLMKALESIYGKSEYDIKSETYFWKADSLLLAFRPHGKHQLEMVYTSFTIKNLMKLDKTKKVEAIADDF
ncbi:MAG TPA: hypothetical protein VD927_19905 [Chryseosolibacter sp.]|nr:hypothetical protein [Chryseosolibacter sp.]